MMNNNGSTLHLPLTPRVVWDNNPRSERRSKPLPRFRVHDSHSQRRGNPNTHLPRIQLDKVGFAQGVHSAPRARRKVHKIPTVPPTPVPPSRASIAPCTHARRK
jgi:hypothetical protein